MNVHRFSSTFPNFSAGIDKGIGKDYNKDMVDHFLYKLTSWRSWPRCLDRRRVIVLVIALVLMIFAWCIATQAEKLNYRDGDLAGSWQMILAVLTTCLIVGLSCGVVEAIKIDIVLLSMSQSPGAEYARNLISRIATWLQTFATSGLLSVLLVGVTQVIERRPDNCKLLPLLTSNCWPTGTAAHQVYEPVA